MGTVLAVKGVVLNNLTHTVPMWNPTYPLTLIPDILNKVSKAKMKYLTKLDV